MNFISLVFVALSVLVSFPASATEKTIKVIYGDDDRIDVYASSNSAFVELSRSTAAMIAHGNFQTASNGEMVISDKTLTERGICKDERFANQITAANCSGFLVSEKHLVTAGHCIKSEADCAAYKWVFDYKVEDQDQGKVVVPNSSVYSCKKIIARELDQMSRDDWALIELDRKVEDRRPLSFRRSGKVRKGDSLVVIGHPTGLPTKIADGAEVRSLSKKFFVANLDTYGGNSGSAVFNVRTSEVEGILVRGETDYEYDPARGCQVSKRCSNDGCRGEDVTYITNVKGLKDL